MVVVDVDGGPVVLAGWRVGLYETTVVDSGVVVDDDGETEGEGDDAAI